MRLYFTYQAKLIVAIVGYGGWNSAGILLTRKWFTKKETSGATCHVPYFFEEHTFTNISYLNILRKLFIQQFQKNPDLLQRTIFQQDGASSHSPGIKFF
jgi:hypothetical protein